MQKAILRLRDTWFMAILNCACALCTCVAQPSVLAICLAAVWQARPLITSRTRMPIPLPNPSEVATTFGVTDSKNRPLKISSKEAPNKLEGTRGI